MRCDYPADTANSPRGVISIPTLAIVLAWLSFGCGSQEPIPLAIGSRTDVAEPARTMDPSAGLENSPTTEAATPAEPSPEMVPPEELLRGLSQGDPQAFPRLFHGVMRLPQPIVASEAAAWVAVLEQLLADLQVRPSEERLRSVVIATRVLGRYGQAPVVDGWMQVLDPVGKLLVQGLADEIPEIRIMALAEIAQLWTWVPDFGVEPDRFSAEDQDRLGSWKASLFRAVLRRLVDPEVKVRVEAVTTLAQLPLDDEARPILHLLQDSEPKVRAAVLAGLVDRPSLMSTQAILPYLYDPSEEVVRAAEESLRGRGLSNSLIKLGRYVVHPDPRMRGRAFSLLEGRDDVDPLIWLLHLSRDQDASVRLGSVKPLSTLKDSQASHRLVEMAQLDFDPQVRQAAALAVPETDLTELEALPPLPDLDNAN